MINKARARTAQSITLLYGQSFISGQVRTPLFATVSIPALELSLLCKCFKGKAQKREADHSLATSTELRMCGSSPPLPA
jgi:hypothetical protein